MSPVFLCEMHSSASLNKMFSFLTENQADPRVFFFWILIFATVRVIVRMPLCVARKGPELCLTACLTDWRDLRALKSTREGLEGFHQRNVVLGYLLALWQPGCNTTKLYHALVRQQLEPALWRFWYTVIINHLLPSSSPSVSLCV